MNWTDEELGLALRDLRDEALPPGALAAVRAQVLARAQPRRRNPWRWAWTPALAAALAVAALVPRGQPPVAPPPLLARAPSAPSLEPWRRPRRPNRCARSSKPRRSGEETQFARILTDDPNVVILWALNSEGAPK